MNRMTEVIKHLIIINVLMYAASWTLFGDNRNILAMYFFASEHFQPYQIVTHMFMHGDMMHLLFNMLSLFFLGTYVETLLGPKRFLFFYLTCGVGAMLAHIGIDAYQYFSLMESIPPDTIQEILNGGKDIITSGRNYSDASLASLNGILNVPMLGASGAVYGVLIAFATLFPEVKLMLIFPPIPVRAKYLALGLIAYDLIAGAGGYSTGIAHFAHLGGALVGFLLIMYWKNTKSI